MGVMIDMLIMLIIKNNKTKYKTRMRKKIVFPSLVLLTIFHNTSVC